MKTKLKAYLFCKQILSNMWVKKPKLKISVKILLNKAHAKWTKNHKPLFLFIYQA